MAIRSGMSNLVQRLRNLTGAGTAEFVSGTVTYWTDDHLQAILDGHYTHFADRLLEWRTEQINGTANYLNAQAPYKDLEEAASGTARWAVRDSAGAFIGTANYSVNYRSGEISFGTVNQMGTAYYLTGYSYDVYLAAADVWLERMVKFTEYFKFSADNQTFDRQQVWEHAEKMEAKMRGKAGDNVIGSVSGDLHVGYFTRTDLNT